MQYHPSIRAVLFFLLGLSLISCLCSFNPAFFVQSPQRSTGTVSASDARTQTHAVPDTPAGEPYLVAAFPSGGKIFLLSPQENVAVTTPWVDVVGTAPAETVISLNDEIAVAGADGYFHARVPLEEGLNEIQCVASDLDGNEVVFSFIVDYEPGG
jgi:hypothetical protein